MVAIAVVVIVIVPTSLVRVETYMSLSQILPRRSEAK